MLKSSLLSIGFRPFFLLGALYAVLSMLLWLLILHGYVAHLGGVFDSVSWHAHEMLFGFSLAVLLGFLLTASQNWSGKPGVHGKALFGLIILWCLGRFTVLSDYHWLEVLVLPMSIVLLWTHLWVKQNTRNRKVIFLLLALSFADIVFHLGEPELGRNLALDIYLGFILLIAGRVIPFFRQRVLGGEKLQSNALLEVLSVLTYLMYVCSSFIDVDFSRPFVAAVLFIVQAFRWWQWLPLQSLRPPILGVLYVGYFWVLVGLLLEALTYYSLIPSSFVTHVFAIGGLGVFMVSMMTRVSLGHTGRKIIASAGVLLVYLFVHLAFLFRVFFPWLFGEKYLLWLSLSGGAWILCFIVFLYKFTEVLVKPRADQS